MTSGICRLCEQSKTLVEGHVVPKFVFRRLKESSVTGHIRLGAQPNRRVQDGYKHYWLCKNCEGKLNGWETEFANALFHPMEKGSHNDVSYGPWLLKFCVSVSWRVLLHVKEYESSWNGFPVAMQKEAEKALNAWKLFLNGKKPHPGSYEQHLICLGPMAQLLPQDSWVNHRNYLLRDIEIDAPFNKKGEIFIYSKMRHLTVLGFVKTPASGQWIGSKVHVKNGIVCPPKYRVPKEFLTYLLGRVKNKQGYVSQISKAQWKIIEKDYVNKISTA